MLEEMYAPIEDGEYAFTIQDAEVKPSKDSTKHPSMKVVLSWNDDSKKKIFQWFYLDTANELSMANLRDFLSAVYKTEVTGAIQLDPKDLVGKEVVAQVTIVARNDDPDKQQNKVVLWSEMPF